MNKYKDDYYIYRPKDNSNKPTLNKYDNYVRCAKNAQIYRYSTDTLAIVFWTNRYANNRLEELSEIGVCMKPFQIGDNEQTYLFSESDFNKVAEVVKAKKRIKRNLTDEQREVLRQRMKNIHSKKDS